MPPASTTARTDQVSHSPVSGLLIIQERRCPCVRLRWTPNPAALALCRAHTGIPRQNSGFTSL